VSIFEHSFVIANTILGELQGIGCVLAGLGGNAVTDFYYCKIRRSDTQGGRCCRGTGAFR